jgi:outer membrane protein assembly factor BamB
VRLDSATKRLIVVFLAALCIFSASVFFISCDRTSDKPNAASLPTQLEWAPWKGGPGRTGVFIGSPPEDRSPEVLWKIDPGRNTGNHWQWASDVVLAGDNTACFALNESKYPDIYRDKLIAVDLGTGALQWSRFRDNEEIRDFDASGGYLVTEIDVVERSTSHAAVDRGDKLVCIDPRLGTDLWKYEGLSTAEDWRGVAVVNGTVYAMATNGDGATEVVGLDFASGAIDTNALVDHPDSAYPIASEDTSILCFGYGVTSDGSMAGPVSIFLLSAPVTSASLSAWVHDADYTYERAAFADGKVYAGVISGSRLSDLRLGAIKLDEVTGEEDWRIQFDEALRHAGGPAVGNDVVVFALHSGGTPAPELWSVEGLDQTTGRRIWTYTTPAAGNPTSPIICNDTVFFGCGPFMYALDLRTGTERWRFETEGTVGAPYIYGEYVLFLSQDADEGRVLLYVLH